MLEKGRFCLAIFHEIIYRRKKGIKQLFFFFGSESEQSFFGITSKRFMRAYVVDHMLDSHAT